MTTNHHSPPGGARPRVFTCEGSPLKGRPVPRDWGSLNCFRAKAQALVDAGLAGSWTDACSLLGRHAAAVKAQRKKESEARAKGEATRRYWD